MRNVEIMKTAIAMLCLLTAPAFAQLMKVDPVCIVSEADARVSFRVDVALKTTMDNPKLPSRVGRRCLMAECDAHTKECQVVMIDLDHLAKVGFDAFTVLPYPGMKIIDMTKTTAVIGRDTHFAGNGAARFTIDMIKKKVSVVWTDDSGSDIGEGSCTK